MTEAVEWLKALFLNYPALKYAIIFLGAAFGGEPAVIAMAFLAAQKFFPMGEYLAVSFLGVLLSDSMYFFLGKTLLVRRLIEHRYATKTIMVILEAIKRLSKGSHMVAFILAKFVIGTRAVIIMYVSKTGISFRYFLRQNLPAIVVWLLIVNAIGYLAGLGFAYLSNLVENIYASVGFVLLFLLLVVIIQGWLRREFIEEEEKIIEENNVV